METILEIKHIQKIRLPSSGRWIIQAADSDDLETPEKDAADKYAEWVKYAFVVRHKIVQRMDSDHPIITTKILIRSDLLRKALRGIMHVAEGIYWNGVVLKLDPELLLAFIPRLRSAPSISGSPDTPGREEAGKQADFLIAFLESEYASTLGKIENLVSHQEITFALLWAIFVPGELIFALCETTGEPRLFRLKKIRRCTAQSEYWVLACEYVNAMEDPSAAGKQFGLAKHTMCIDDFDGIQKITELPAYPLKYHPGAAVIRKKLAHRGQKWANLHGLHHKQYNGLASRSNGCQNSRVQIDGRIMIDRGTFTRVEPDYPRHSAHPSPMDKLTDPINNGDGPRAFSGDAAELKDDELLLATPIVYGFSFSVKRWLEFNVECVTDIQWDDDGFKNLAIDIDRKMLIQGLVNSHATLKGKRSADDFVEGKGLGLIMNLFGPPGVGKTLTVEATSEHLRRPLYVVSAGDLGTTPTNLDKELTKIFSLVPVWDAVVLIDEADVFLEERGTADMERNAMVAVFLRQLEYFQGVLFLTTNRVKQFDAAFQSRIHLSLRYNDLSHTEKGQLWCAFLERTRTTGLGYFDLSKRQLRALSHKDLNGRQIKNIVRLAVALAAERKEALTYGHLVKTMTVTDNWLPASTGVAVAAGLGVAFGLSAATWLFRGRH